MDLTIKSKKQLEHERLALHNCVCIAFWFGSYTQQYLHSKWYPEQYIEGTQKRFAKSALGWLKPIEKKDAEALKFVLCSCTKTTLEFMIEDLGDEGEEYRKYLGMLD